MNGIARQRVIRFLSMMTGVEGGMLQSLPDDVLQDFAVMVVELQR